MRSEKILEMLNKGEIEELKKALENEIYEKNFDKGSGKKERYQAMKRYFKIASDNAYDKRLCMPCKTKVNGKEMTCFIDGHCVACTFEEPTGIQLYEEWKDGANYFDVNKLLDTKSYKVMAGIDLQTAIAEAKSKGYKYTKANKNNLNYIFHFINSDAYFNMFLLDKAYSIIAGGENEEIYYYDKKSMLIVENSIGIVAILPFNHASNTKKENAVYIER